MTTTRYCKKCHLQISFADDDIRCPICSQETALDTEQAKIERVRKQVIKALRS